MYICDRCGKGLQVGMNVSHSHRRTKRRSLPNLHITSIYIDGKRVRARFCTKCLRIMRAAYPYIQPADGKVVVKEVKKETPKVEKKAPVEVAAV